MSKKFKKSSPNYIIGIDEVGRGALAGPVTVAAIVLPINIRTSQVHRTCDVPKLKDSKKLSLRQREIWFDFIKKSALSYEIAAVSPKIIDKINISNAANLAATRALQALTTDNKQLTSDNYKIYLDGGLRLNKVRCQMSDVRCIIKGDEKIPAISLASIVAKVSRDRLMKKLHKKYPRYDFIHNVGYGTKKHIKAIKKYGLSQIHRRSFKII